MRLKLTREQGPFSYQLSKGLSGQLNGGTGVGIPAPKQSEAPPPSSRSREQGKGKENKTIQMTMGRQMIHRELILRAYLLTTPEQPRQHARDTGPEKRE